MRKLVWLLLVISVLALLENAASAQGVIVWPQVPVVAPVPGVGWGSVETPPNPLPGVRWPTSSQDLVQGVLGGVVGRNTAELAQAAWLASEAHAVERHGRATFDTIGRCPVIERWYCPRTGAPGGHRIYHVHDCTSLGYDKPGVTIYETWMALVTRYWSSWHTVGKLSDSCSRRGSIHP